LTNGTTLQDILRISTFLDLFGNAKEDLSIFPVFFQHIFTLLGYGSFIAEIFILISIPFVIKKESISKLEVGLITVVILLLIYFLSAVLLDPRFSILLI